MHPLLVACQYYSFQVGKYTMSNYSFPVLYKEWNGSFDNTPLISSMSTVLVGFHPRIISRQLWTRFQILHCPVAACLVPHVLLIFLSRLPAEKACDLILWTMACSVWLWDCDVWNNEAESTAYTFNGLMRPDFWRQPKGFCKTFFIFLSLSTCTAEQALVTLC